MQTEFVIETHGPGMVEFTRDVARWVAGSGDGLVTLMDEAAAAAPRLGLPVLYLYGEKDEVVPAEPSRKVMSALSQPHRVEVYPQGYHMLLHDKQRETVYADIMDWLGERRVAMPVSGTP